LSAKCGRYTDRRLTSMQPKVFISYSWTSEQHQNSVREIAERLLSDGVGIVMDVFDLREGDDKYAFMERMVTAPLSRTYLSSATRRMPKRQTRGSRAASRRNHKYSQKKSIQRLRSQSLCPSSANSPTAESQLCQSFLHLA
jgi:hypothetical protein